MENMKSEIWHPDEDLLIDYADRLLDPDESSQVTEHLEACLDCQHKVKAFEARCQFSVGQDRARARGQHLRDKLRVIDPH